jgi:hypothetical protein
MSQDVLAATQGNLRGTDSNSLLRLYDQARAICLRSPLQQERLKAAKVSQRIARELKRRQVSVDGATAGRISTTLTPTIP